MAENHTNSTFQKRHVHGFRGSMEDGTDNTLHLKVLPSDNGGEYLSGSFNNFIADDGIQHQDGVSYTPT